MSIERIGRIPNRVRQDLKIISLAKNWREILSAKLRRRPLRKVFFRNGTVLESPPEVDLMFLLHELWLDEIYGASGYEVRQGDKIIDIGGNIGAFAIYAAGVATDVTIYSYEPFPENFRYLKKNVADSGLKGVKVFEAAVAGVSEDRHLEVDESWVKHSLTSEGSHGLKVKCISLDDIMAELGSCDLLKIDCEGGEYEIFYNANAKTLSKIKRIVCEYHGGHESGKKLKDFFETRDFRVDVFSALDETTGLIHLTRSNRS